MSRVGNAPIPLPSNVDINISGSHVTVKGPQGVLERDVPSPISVITEEGVIKVVRPNDERRNKALHGLVRALVNNMVVGVTNGFVKELEIVGVGYRATPQGPNQIQLALGFSHPVNVTAPDGVTFEVPQQTRINIKGIDKEKVGQVAANIRKIRKPEPYKGKGVKYVGERIVRKAGKAGK